MGGVFRAEAQCGARPRRDVFKRNAFQAKLQHLVNALCISERFSATSLAFIQTAMIKLMTRRFARYPLS